MQGVQGKPLTICPLRIMRGIGADASRAITLPI
jgi:hypothetical protein